jgi:large subunit ribosomal protein L29
MTAKEIRAMSDASLQDRLKALYHETFNLRFQQATSQLTNSARFRTVRREIACIRTILGERSRGATVV